MSAQVEALQLPLLATSGRAVAALHGRGRTGAGAARAGAAAAHPGGSAGLHARPGEQCSSRFPVSPSISSSQTLLRNNNNNNIEHDKNKNNSLLFHKNTISTILLFLWQLLCPQDDNSLL